MTETLNYVPAKEGLTALDCFLARKSNYEDVLPFTLPVRRSIGEGEYSVFRYHLGVSTGVKRMFRFSLSNKKLTALSDDIYVTPHSEISRGYNPYYWLNLHASLETDSPILISCRLRPEEEKHKIDFLTWHGLEEQLFADYVLDINGLQFADLLPVNLTVINRDFLSNYWIAAVKRLSIRLGNNPNVQNGDILRFVFKTDDQKLYKWVDILKVVPELPEERWPLISSYRILPEEHRLYSNGWHGPERQLLLDRILGRSGIEFKNLRPIKAFISNNGKKVNLVSSADLASVRRGIQTQPILLDLYLKNPLAEGEETETISIPKQDNEKIYEWLEIYCLNPQTDEPIGEMMTSARITPEGLNQRDWPGIEKQLLKDYISGLIKFDHLKDIKIQVGNAETIHLCMAEGRMYLGLLPRFKLKPNDNLILAPEKETEEGTDFLLVKDGTNLARYRLDLKTKKFTCIDNFVETESKDLSMTPEEADKRLMDFFEEV